MFDDKNRAEAAGDQIKGKAQEAWGKLTDDESLQAEGKANQAKGQVREKAEDAGDTVRGAGEAIKDAIDGDSDRTRQTKY